VPGGCPLGSLGNTAERQLLADRSRSSAEVSPRLVILDRNLLSEEIGQTDHAVALLSTARPLSVGGYADGYGSIGGSEVLPLDQRLAPAHSTPAGGAKPFILRSQDFVDSEDVPLTASEFRRRDAHQKSSTRVYCDSL